MSCVLFKEEFSRLSWLERGFWRENSLSKSFVWGIRSNCTVCATVVGIKQVYIIYICIVSINKWLKCYGKLFVVIVFCSYNEMTQVFMCVFVFCLYNFSLCCSVHFILHFRSKLGFHIVHVECVGCFKSKV